MGAETPARRLLQCTALHNSPLHFRAHASAEPTPTRWLVNGISRSIRIPISSLHARLTPIKLYRRHCLVVWSKLGCGMNIVIKGDGVAAYCSLRLLKRAGHRAMLAPTERPRLPAIMLGDASLALIRDVFDRPDLIGICRESSVELWLGRKTLKPLPLEHSAVVVSEEYLLDNLRLNLPMDDAEAPPDADWTIFASRPLPHGAAEQRFGTRVASAARVRLKDERDSAACWIESLEDGWLFLIPDTSESGWLLSVGQGPETLLGRSRIIAERIESCAPASGEFPACPRILSPLGESGWLACGTAAMAFDPICGDGTAHAIREAILASAVIRAIAEGENSTELIAHFQARLTAGFQRHLALCQEFYRSGYGGDWWGLRTKRFGARIAVVRERVRESSSISLPTRWF